MDELLLGPGPAAARDLSDRAGFDAGFLGVPVPVPTLAGVETVLLPYTHFSVLMRPDKRLAAVTALGIDGAKLMDLDRSGIRWRLDPRLGEDQQTGERVYARNDIDRGHLVRRASAVWGETRDEAARANEDTFHYTNAAPQAATFNQGLGLWLGLESYLQDNAADNGRRLVVFTGPIFSDTDPAYRGVNIPAAVLQGRRLPPPRGPRRHRLHRGPDTRTRQPARRPAARRHRRGSPAWPVPHLPGPRPRHCRPDRPEPGPARGRRPDADRPRADHRTGHLHLETAELAAGPRPGLRPQRHGLTSPT